MDVNLNIDAKDIAQVKEYLKDKACPVDLQEITDRIALFKTRDSRAHKVKIYNPNCEYKVGDLIYKEYPGRIPIGSKASIEIQEGVVLTVQAVRTRFGINEVVLKYEGTSDFKKYTAYLERQKIELLLPHKQQKPYEKPEYIAEEIDPRRQSAPLEKKDLTALSKKLVVFLNKETEIALIGNKVLLKSHLKPIEDTVFDKIREFLKENKKSEHTEFFVEHFAHIKPDDEAFDAYCFSLSYRMLKDYRIDFQQTQEAGWGKWNMISVLYYMKKDSPISDSNPLIEQVFLSDKKNLAQRRRKFEEAVFPEGITNRFYLTQREIMAGAVRLKPGFYDLGDSIEVEAYDGKYKKPYLIYYYKEDHLLLGFKEIFDKYKALQGTILTFEMVPNSNGEGNQLVFNIRVTKKGTIADRVEYHPEEKAFVATDEKVASPSFVLKAMFLEAAVFKKVHENLAEYRQIDSLNKLIHKVFLEFGVKERNYEIHIMRLHHIIDLIYPTDLRTVEDVILSNPEFVPEEKMPGIFYLDSDAVVGIEEEESKRREIMVDEQKQKRDEGRRKKQEQERRIKEEIRRKREERRRKREQEMWEKERLLKEAEEKKLKESQKDLPKEQPEPIRKPATPAEPAAPVVTKPVAPSGEVHPTTPEPQKPASTPEDLDLKKEHNRKPKKKVEEEKPPVKAPKRADRKATDDIMSEDDIKSTIELERLKEEMRNRTDIKKSDKKKEIAYKDNDSGFGGIFASKLDEIVKKESDKDKK